MNYSTFGFGDTAVQQYNSNKAIEVGIFDDDANHSSTELKFEEGIVAYHTSEGEETKLFVDNRSEDTKFEIDNTKVVSTSSLKNLRFHVMGGCFSKLSNAQGLVQSLKTLGFDARLLGTYKNLYAVSFGSFAKREEAIELLATVKNSENPDAWLLVKPF